MVAELIFTSPHPVRGPAGAVYAVRVYGQPRADGLWAGWLVFTETTTGRTLRTARETTQPNRDALVYWATGLEPVYLEGALDRAHRWAPRPER